MRRTDPRKGAGEMRFYFIAPMLVTHLGCVVARLRCSGSGAARTGVRFVTYVSSQLFL